MHPLVISFNPVFTAILAVLFLGERFTARMGAGLGLGVAGVVLIFLRSPNVALDPQDRMIGDGLILLGKNGMGHLDDPDETSHGRANFGPRRSP